MRNLLLTVHQHGGDDVTCKLIIGCHNIDMASLCLLKLQNVCSVIFVLNTGWEEFSARPSIRSTISLWQRQHVPSCLGNLGRRWKPTANEIWSCTKKVCVLNLKFLLNVKITSLVKFIYHSYVCIMRKFVPKNLQL
jgi:hypothetical protein